MGSAFGSAFGMAGLGPSAQQQLMSGRDGAGSVDGSSTHGHGSLGGAPHPPVLLPSYSSALSYPTLSAVAPPLYGGAYQPDGLPLPGGVTQGYSMSRFAPSPPGFDPS